jgi:hypothetical protein
MPRSSRFNRLVVAGIAAAAISPTAALASPALDGGVTAPHKQDMRAPDQVAGGAPGTGVMQDMRTPDQVDGSTVDRQTPAGMPTWPTNPKPIPNRFVATTSTPAADDNGIDGGVLVAIGGGALLLVGGIGLAGRKRLQLVRQRQPA